MAEYKFIINGSPYGVKIKSISDDKAKVEVNGVEYNVDIKREAAKAAAPRVKKTPVVPSAVEHGRVTGQPGKPAGMNVVKSPLPGIITEIVIPEGKEVKAGQCVVKMEAMKMENEIQSPMNGVIKQIHVKEGQNVLEGEAIFEVGSK